jgi:hypothetical protein
MEFEKQRPRFLRLLVVLDMFVNRIVCTTENEYLNNQEALWFMTIYIVEIKNGHKKKKKSLIK